MEKCLLLLCVPVDMTGNEGEEYLSLALSLCFQYFPLQPPSIPPAD